MSVTIHETIDQLHTALKDYIEATYHIADPKLITQRRRLLDAPGVIHQIPYLESTPKYLSGSPFREIDGLPAGALEAFELLSQEVKGQPRVIHDPAYTHQVKAIAWSLVERRNLVIMTGTGSGKTESFLLPILGKLAREASERPNAFREQPAMRALILYPMNALVNDQLGRLRAMFGDPRIAQLFSKWAGRPARFARYTSRTPYAGVRTRKKDQRRLKSFEEFYVDLERASGNPMDPDHELATALKGELKSRGKWPAKPDLVKWFGEKKSLWQDKAGKPTRAVTRPLDVELVTRHEVQAAPPDLLVTNYSMLEYMLMRPIERTIFDRTAEWLKLNPDETFLVVLDEAHLYRGAPGAEVGLLLRRLRARLGIGVERLQVICATASFDDSSYAPFFGAQLSGAPAETFKSVTGNLALAEHAGQGVDLDVEVFASVDLDAFYGHPTLRKLAVKKVLDYRGVKETGDIEHDLYVALVKYPPLGQLINRTMGDATPLAQLAKVVFPTATGEVADRAVTSLLALSSVARPSPSAAGLLPCRVHNFFRGLPGLWVCLDAECTELASDERNGICGRLYSQPRERCGCGAQVLEYFTCRNCGSSYARSYTDNIESPQHLWSHPGSKLHLSTGDVEPLFPLDLLLEEPLKNDVAELKSLDLVTAAVDACNEGSRKRDIFIRRDRSSGASDDDGNQDTRLEARGEFVPCGVCGGTAAFARSTVQDHQTKGDQPFQTLVSRQLQVQPPSQQAGTSFAPLQGRKVLAFSDSRQVAARLAPNLQMYSTRDALRPMLVLGFEQLGTVATIRQRLSLDDAYLAVLLASATRNVRLRPEMVPGESLAGVDRVRQALAGVEAPDEDKLFDLWLDMKSDKAPSALLDDIYKSLFDKHLGLEPLAFASVSVRYDKLKKVSDLPSIPGIAENADQKLELVEAWLRCWWRSPGAGIWMRDMPESWWQRSHASGTSVKSHKGIFEAMKKFLADKTLAKTFTSEWLPKLMTELTGEAEAGQRRMLASNLSLRFGGTWQRCATCKSVHRPVSTIRRCLDCGSNRVATLNPESDEAFVARKGNYRKPVIETRNGAPLLSLIAAEHTAQLNSAGSDEAFSRAEEHELLFQDVELVWKGIVRNPTAIDVLSSTTTMEVGIDIGALSGVALRNMPPSRANYQQRAGRAGRRGNAVATVVSFGSADSHDEHYFSNPQGMVSGKVIDPKLALANADIARRHIRAFLLQTYHQAKVVVVNPAESQDLFSVLGTVSDFKSSTGQLNRADFETWLSENAEGLQRSLRDWLPKELDDEREPLVLGMVEDCLQAIDKALADSEVVGKTPLSEDEDSDGSEGESGFEAGEERPSVGAAPTTLLNRLLYFGILPRYAFPTDVATFTVFDERSNGFRHIARFSPSQSLHIALSQYAPGKEVWIANKCYTSAAVYSPIRSERSKAYKERMCYRECSTCGFAETKDLSLLPRGSISDCIACGDSGTFGPAQYWMRPPGFAHPYNRAPVTSPDDSPETSYATRAKLMIPTPATDANWLKVNERVRVFPSREHLLVSNTGPEKKGYTYCSWCGAIEADTDPSPKLRGPHTKPFPDKEPMCDGTHSTKNLVLGTKFITDVALFSLQLGRPLELRPGTYPTNVALRTVCEALAKAAASMLGIEPGEVLAEYRPAITEDSAGREGLQAEVFLYDTLPGGAGFARLAAEDAPRLFSIALDAMRDCPDGCDASCYRCLRSFKNKVEHRLLDRHVGAELLEHLLTGVVPQFDGKRISAATDLLFTSLNQQAEGESYEANVEIPGTGHVPIVATRTDGSKVAVLLAAPLSADVALDEDIHQRLRCTPGWSVVVVNELLIRHHLPAACRDVMSAVLPSH